MPPMYSPDTQEKGFHMSQIEFLYRCLAIQKIADVEEEKKRKEEE